MAERLWEAADHVAAFFGVHVLGEGGVGVGVCDPVGVAEAGIGEGDVGEGLDERRVEAAEIGELMSDDVLDFVLVFRGKGHPEIAEVGDSGDGAVEFLFCEGSWKEEESGADGGEEVDLIGETDARVVTEDFDGFLEAACEI